MKNNKSTLKTLPKNTKFSKFNSTNEDDVLLEFLIANLIHNEATFNELMEPANLIVNKKDREEMKTKIYNTILGFINLNPKYVSLLNSNEFSNFLGLDF